MLFQLLITQSPSEIESYLGQWPSETSSVKSSRELQEEADNFEFDDRTTYPTSVRIKIWASIFSLFYSLSIV